MTLSVVIVGATSSIGRSLAHAYASKGYDICLVGRDDSELEIVAADVKVRYPVGVHTVAHDVLRDQASDLVAACLAGGTPIRGVITVVGYLGDTAQARREPQEMERIARVNFTSVASLLEAFAERFTSEGEPLPSHVRARRFLCVLTSVAGDRGRQSNYPYGASKAALSVYIQGLRHRLARYRITVTDVRPGFVDTKMTYGRPGLIFLASPDDVARDVFRAVERGRSTIYTRGIWRLVMAIIRAVPEPIFHRTKL